MQINIETNALRCKLQGKRTRKEDEMLPYLRMMICLEFLLDCWIAFINPLSVITNRCFNCAGFSVGKLASIHFQFLQTTCPVLHFLVEIVPKKGNQNQEFKVNCRDSGTWNCTRKMQQVGIGWCLEKFMECH